jgi:apolipoprotein D and lipocalin family protein
LNSAPMIQTALALLLVLVPTAHAAEMPIDLDRYAGTWHEIARVPNYFQRKCTSGVTATYSRQDDHVLVVNRCVKSDGKVITAEGKASITDPPLNTKLKVGFFSIFGWMPFKGDYWILDIDPEYRWVIVGGPTTKYGWILARTPTLDAATRADVDARLRRFGYAANAFSAGAAPEQ